MIFIDKKVRITRDKDKTKIPREQPKCAYYAPCRAIKESSVQNQVAILVRWPQNGIGLSDGLSKIDEVQSIGGS